MTPDGYSGQVEYDQELGAAAQSNEENNIFFRIRQARLKEQKQDQEKGVETRYSSSAYAPPKPFSQERPGISKSSLVGKRVNPQSTSGMQWKVRQPYKDI